MLIRDLPTGATFRRGPHAYRIVGETYQGAGPGVNLRRDIVRVDGAGGVLHAPARWAAERDPGRHADPNVKPDDGRPPVFVPARVPVGGTVRGAISGKTFTVADDDRGPDAPGVMVYGRDGYVAPVDVSVVRRDRGRHRGGDDTRPGTPPVVQNGDVQVPQAAPFPIPAPALPYAGPWSLDGHGNVRVPVTLVRNLLSDLRSIQSVIYENSDPLTLDDWPAAREFILGAREV